MLDKTDSTLALLERRQCPTFSFGNSIACHRFLERAA
jgi:hypothetical protein